MQNNPDALLNMLLRKIYTAAVKCQFLQIYMKKSRFFLRLSVGKDGFCRSVVYNPDLSSENSYIFSIFQYNTQLISKLSYLFCILSFPLFSLPTPPRLEELVRDSDYIARVKLSGCIQKKITEKEISVNCKGDILEAYKTKTPLPGRLNIGFMVLPEKFGKWLRSPPREGEYILHFINREATDSRGNQRNLVVLYEPHPFAIHEYSKEYETKIRTALK